MRCSWLIVATSIAWLVLDNGACAKGFFDLFMSPSDDARIGEEEHPKILEEFGGRTPILQLGFMSIQLDSFWYKLPKHQMRVSPSRY